MNSTKIWPYAIGASILLVFGFAVATIVVTSTMPVEKSDIYMMYYQEADANANELIEARIAFDKKYNVEYITDTLSKKSTVIRYKVYDKNFNPVNSAKIKVIITRPNNHKDDQELNNPTVENGIYTFAPTTLPKEGRWNVMAKVNVDDLQRFYNVKADTRTKEALEY
jgi:nitrogen fixation protein FixH